MTGRDIKMEKKFKLSEKELLKEIGKYLEAKGWKALVIGFKGITKRELKYNYSLIIDFTGKKIKKLSGFEDNKWKPFDK